MKTKKITENEISELKVASLPTRPTAPVAYGGRGFTSGDMKAAFDKLPLFIISRLNSLIEDITAGADSSICTDIKTGIKEGHTLHSLFSDILSGIFCEYLCVGAESFSVWKARVDAKLLNK